MEIFCAKCKVDFKDEDQVVLDIMSNLTHEDCYDGQSWFHHYFWIVQRDFRIICKFS